MRPFLTVVLGIFILSGCGEDTVLDTLMMIEYDEEFTLQVGQTAISPDSAVVRIIDITHDSRCPSGVDCLWEGEIVMQLEGAFEEQLYPLEVRNLVSQSSLSSANFVRFRLELIQANPYPDSNKNDGQIEIDDYRISLILRQQ